MRKFTIAIPLAVCCVALPALAQAMDIPARKAGQWKIEMQLPVPGMKAMVTQLCLDADTDKQLMNAGMGMATDCTTTQNGNGFDSVCTFGGMTTKTHAEISGDFQSSYKMKITTDRVGGPANMPKHSEITQAATWEGECKGLEPGEMLMPGGMKMNALQALKPGG